MTKTLKVELTVNMHDGKITSLYIDKIESGEGVTPTEMSLLTSYIDGVRS